MRGKGKKKREPASLNEGADAHRNEWKLFDIQAREEREARKRLLPKCSICLQTLEQGESLVGMCCLDPPQHIFHRDCIEHWRANPRSLVAKLCPVCGVDPVAAIQMRLHFQSVRTVVNKERKAWCQPKKWSGYVKQARPWILLVLTVAVTLLFGAWTVMAWMRVHEKMEMLQAPRLRDESLL